MEGVGRERKYNQTCEKGRSRKISLIREGGVEVQSKNVMDMKREEEEEERKGGGEGGAKEC